VNSLDESILRAQRCGGGESRSEMLYSSIQGVDDWIEWTFAFAYKCCGEELRQSNERSIPCIEIERSASNSEHPP
jgi:hypothetical protein